MLKIKDNINLKELEKFGWYDKNDWRIDPKHIDTWGHTYYPEYSNGKFTIQKNRHIRSRAGNQYNGLDDLFDIIQAGFVEKV